MVVNVRAKVNLLDITGEIEVAVGNPGVISDTTEPPDQVYDVVFTTGTSQTAQRWVTENDILFDDGPLGPVRAMVEDGQHVISEVIYPEKVSDQDMLLGEKFTMREDVMRVDFENGNRLTVTADRNTGRLKFDLGRVG
jgi:hypothetical protein